MVPSNAAKVVYLLNTIIHSLSFAEIFLVA